MQEITLQAEIRTQLRKQNRALRKDGKVPGVYYIHGEDNIPVTMLEKALKSLVHSSETHIINLALSNGDSKKCILRDIQFDPITDRPLHFDVQGLREDETITIEVPVVITGGTPIGVRDGGILQHFVHRLRLECLPKYIPDHIEINAENLTINHSIHVSDIKIENVKILDNETMALVGVIPPVVEKEVVPGTVEETTEPEVIAKGKKLEEGEGAEGEAAAKPAAAPKAAEAKEEKKK